ncbi:REP-associated tyrosine transposase [Tautonia marina]|uniref:REP-associated tyrosine transposase n=1 Tax=Tautonia marina TaxID=2653855 RepID=UPI00126106E0|nr:transposase [Tautonia marina]
MSNRPIADEERYVHFITFSCDHRRRLLDHDHPRRIVLGVLNGQLTRQGATCVGFVVMPDHVHALIWLPRTHQLSAFMHEWKRQSSFRIRSWYRDMDAAYFKEIGHGDRFWQPKYYAFAVHSRAKLEEKLKYIHLNPVRAGLVERPVDWPWSSARWYEQGRSVGVPIGWVE